MKLKYFFFGFVAVFLLAIGAIVYFGEDWAEQLLREKIDEVESLSYDSLNLNIASRKMKFSGLKYSENGNEISVENVIITGIKIYPLILTKTINIDSIYINGGSLKYTLKEKAVKSNSKKTIDIPDFNVKHVKVSDTFIEIFNQDKEQPFASSKLYIELEELNNIVVKSPKSITNNIVKFNLNQSKYYSKDSLYLIKSKIITLDPTTNSIKVDSIGVKCNYKKYALGHIVGHETDWISFKLDSLKLDFENLDSLIYAQRAKKVTLESPTLKVFRDKRLPFPKNHHPKILRELLADDALSFDIDSLEIKNANITYEEFVKQSLGPGRVSFNNLNGYVTNFTTYDRHSKAAPRLTATCKLMNKSKMYADIAFPLSKNGSTHVKGKLEPMDLTEFNVMLKFVAFTKIKEGKLKKLDFDFKYDRVKSNGKMNFAYENLKIEFLKKNTVETEGIFNDFKGFVANTFVVDSKNTYDSGKFRMGEIAFERDMEKSMFNFWWNSILTGFRSSTGVNASGEKIDVN